MSSSLTMNTSGYTIPTNRYINSVSSDFPNSNRVFKVESGITSRYVRDYLPINANLSNGAVDDNYIEFILNSNETEFVDCTSFALEMKMKIVNSIGEKPVIDSKYSVIDGLGRRIISRFTLFLNGVPIESNSYFGLYNTLKTYTSMSKAKLDGVGRNMYYKDLSIPIENKFNNENFPSKSEFEMGIIEDCKSTLHFMSPLHLDIGSGGFYLMNGVDVRLRFDLSPASLIINSIDNVDYKYVLQNVKLWVQKVVPHNDALISLNKSLISTNSSVEYLIDRPIIKNFVFPTGQSILSVDDIFNGIIPHMVYIFFINQRSLSGSYDRNGAYFTNCDLSSLRMDLNGNTVTSMSSIFPNQVANLFYHTIFNLKDSKHLLTHQNFKKGRTIYTWDLASSDCCDDLKIEKSGNLRINVQLASPNEENVIMFAVGITTGLIEIDSARRVKTSYLM